MNMRKVFAAILALLGAVFFAQGTGLLTQFESVMNNNPTWTIIGLAMVIAGLLVWPQGSATGK